MPKAKQEQAGLPQVADAARRDEAHLEHEQREHALEQVEEQLRLRGERVGAGDPSDQQAAGQQHDAAAEEHLVRERTPPHDAAGADLGEQDAHDDARHLEQHDEQGHVLLHAESLDPRGRRAPPRT